MKIAILHEMLVKLGGAEKVVEQFLSFFPEANLFTLIYDETKVGSVFPREKIHEQVFTLGSQKVYTLLKNQRFCLPFMAKSVESLDFSEYDVVLCSSSAFAHGAITKPDTKFIVYYHAPARYMWDWTNEYQADLGLRTGIKRWTLGPIIKNIFYKNRQWDYIASKRVDISLANSKNTKNRIKKYYRKEAAVLYPPVEVARFQTPAKKGEVKLPYKDYYVIVSALKEFKKIDIAIKAFNHMSDLNLIIIGKGEHKEQLSELVNSDNISFVGPQYGEDLVYFVQQSMGLIFPGEEDFGIVPIEAMAAGKPVFALQKGGLLETVEAGKTGEFFADKEGFDFIAKFEKFHSNNLKNLYTQENCQTQAKNFSGENFEKEIKKYIQAQS